MAERATDSPNIWIRSSSNARRAGVRHSGGAMKRRRVNGNAARSGNGASLPMVALASDHPCVDCAQCCRYVAIEIDAPTTMTEYDYLVWYLVHPGISVFVDWNGGWFVKFESRCQHLQTSGMCGIYESRPVICREFDWKECERHLTDEPADKWLFRSAEEFTTWLARQRPKAHQKFLAFQREHRRKRTPKELRRLRVTDLPLHPA